MAQALAQRSPSALRADKRLMNASSQVLADSARALLQAESDEQVALMGQPNQLEAVRANMEQRAPVFSTAQA
jgi:enoyl-CoA hydratase/carnithine racemase